MVSFGVEAEPLECDIFVEPFRGALIARAYGKQGIRANACDPDMGRNKKQMEVNTDEERAHIPLILQTPRFGETYEFAAFSTFLNSDEAPSVNVHNHLTSGLDGTR